MPSSIPKEVDIGVNGIFISDNYGVGKILGDSLNLLKATTHMPFPHINYVNKDSTELLVLISHHGAYKYEFSEFRITKFNQPFREEYTVLSNVVKFTTYKGLSLGMNVSEFRKIFGFHFYMLPEGDTIEYVYQLRDDENSPFLEFYNMPIYYGNYTFKNDQLIKIEFGFKYP